MWLHHAYAKSCSPTRSVLNKGINFHYLGLYKGFCSLYVNLGVQGPELKLLTNPLLCISYLLVKVLGQRIEGHH
jgi:hypothetical protein